MKRRKWNAHSKAMIVIEGLKGKPVAELCADADWAPTTTHQAP
jgi:hypothetical protein